MSDDRTEAKGLLRFIDASPSPFHACREAARHLAEAGFQELHEVDAWELGQGNFFVVRGGSLVAWSTAGERAPETGFRLIAAHTDSPNLRLKPQPDIGSVGYRQLGVEIYGGVLLGSWLDRDLGLSGRVWVRNSSGGEAPEARLLQVDRPVLRVPQLAIHLNRDVNTKGLILNPQKHMPPVWGLKGGASEPAFREFVADELGVATGDVLSWDVMCHDVNPSCLIGVDEEFVSAPRLDNLASCFHGLRAVLAATRGTRTPARIPVLCLFDHEEVGSGSRGGANGPLLRSLLERSVLARGGGREHYHRAIADSVCLSADMAHATHPNYPEMHDSEHRLKINGGPVIKLNTNQRYATEGETEALFQLACEAADVPYQKWINRTDLACGSTIGPITAANLGLRTVDVGNPQLAMHSVREMCGSLDPGYMTRAMTAFLE